MLQTSFYMLVDYIALGWPECEAYLERIGVAHGKHGRDIAPPLYDLWLDCLLHAAKECDQQWSPEVAAAWRYMMGPVPQGSLRPSTARGGPAGFALIAARSASQSHSAQQTRKARIRTQAVISGIDLEVSEPGPPVGIAFLEPGKRGVRVPEPRIKRGELVGGRWPLGFERLDPRLEEPRP